MGFSTIIITSKKIVAVALTAAMCLGLSMTAFAAKNTGWSNDNLWSPHYLQNVGVKGEKTNEGTIVGFNGKRDKYVVAKNAKGQSIDVSWRDLDWNTTLKDINTEEKVADIFKKNGYEVSDNANFIPLLSGDINFNYGIPKDGAQLVFTLADLGVDPQGVKPGETVYLMQEVGGQGSGVWDVFAAEVGPNYDVTFTVPRSGALVLVKVTPNGTVQLVDKTTGDVVDTIIPGGNVTGNQAGGNSTSTNASASGATSPKTGEF